MLVSINVINTAHFKIKIGNGGNPIKIIKNIIERVCVIILRFFIEFNKT
jgi:hypothetical protein